MAAVLLVLLVITHTITSHPDKSKDLLEVLENESLLRDSEERTNPTELLDVEPTKTNELNEKTNEREKLEDKYQNGDIETTTEDTELLEKAVDDKLFVDYSDASEKVDISTTLATETTETESLATIDNNAINNDSLLVNKMESSTPTTPKDIEEMEAIGPTLVGLEDVDGPEERSLKTGGNQEVPPLPRAEPNPSPPPTSTSAILRQWLEDQWLRPPAGILVPLRSTALNRALAVWTDLTFPPLSHSDIVLVGYHNNGVSWRSRHNLQQVGKTQSVKTGKSVSDALSKLLVKYQGVNMDSSDGTMQALISAAKLVPYDSALFVVTDRGAGDGGKLPLALRALLEKRLKVYIIWTDPNYPSEESKMALQELRNVSIQTDGDILPYSIQDLDIDNPSTLSNRAWSVESKMRQGRYHSVHDYEKLDTLLVWRGGGEAISLGVPVENGVSALRIYIEGLVEHAVLYPPNEAPQVDLYNQTSVLSFSPASRTERLSPRDVFLAFPGSEIETDLLSVLPMEMPNPLGAQAPTVGLWHLSVRCDTCDYRLCVTARTNIHLDVSLEAQGDTLKLRVSGPVGSVRETVLVDEYGVELSKLPFSYEPQAGDSQDRKETSPELLADVSMPKVKGNRVYVKIVGRDLMGEPFIRLAGPLNQEVRTGRSAPVPTVLNDMYNQQANEIRMEKALERLRYNESSILPSSRAISQVVNQRGTILTAVQIGLSTRLYGAPGDTLQLHFEVTNYREQSVRFQFEAVGELRFLRGINPTSQTLQSGQTAIVIVTLTISASAQPGARDLITFTAYGLDQVSISAYVYVRNAGDSALDSWPPEVRHSFQGSCIGRLAAEDCAQHAWSASIVARDSVAGLLRLTSTPVGVTYDSNFVSGTREEVVALYRATCCSPRVVVTAVDSYGNANSHVIDISGYLSEAAIASIVLGVFLLIAIIALVIFLIYWCVRRRKESRELPSYATTSRNN